MKKAIICFSVICMCIVVSYVTRLLTIKEYSMETRVELYTYLLMIIFLMI